MESQFYAKILAQQGQWQERVLQELRDAWDNYGEEVTLVLLQEILLHFSTLEKGTDPLKGLAGIIGKLGVAVAYQQLADLKLEESNGSF